jgi:hypothetical protein
MRRGGVWRGGMRRPGMRRRGARRGGVAPRAVRRWRGGGQRRGARQRGGRGLAERGAGDARRLADLDGRERLEHVVRLAQQRRIDGGESAQLGRRGAQVRGHPRVGEVLGGEDVGLAAVRCGPDRLGLGLQGGEERLGALGRSGRERVERDERRTAEPLLPDRAGGAGGADRGAPHPRLQRVGGGRVGQPPGRPQPGQQVGGAPAG